MQNLKIKNNIPVQENFLGNGAIYHGYAAMDDHMGRVYTNELCDIEADRAADMKLKFARTFYTWWAWDEEKKLSTGKTELCRHFMHGLSE